MEKKYIIGIVVVLVVLVGGFLIMKNSAMAPYENSPATDTSQGTPISGATQNPSYPQNTTPPANTAPQGQVTTNSGATIVVYTEQGFIPETVTIKKGGTVTFKNKSGRKMWIAANPHPIHTGYPEKSPSDCLGSSFDACTGVVAGADWSFTFNSAGTWRYHDHLRENYQGTVVVQ